MIPPESPANLKPDEIFYGDSCGNDHDVYFRDFRFYCSEKNCESFVSTCPNCLGDLVFGDDFGEYCEAAFCYFSNDYDRCGDMLKNRIYTYTHFMSDILAMDDPWHLDQTSVERDLDAALERKIISSKERLELQRSLEESLEHRYSS